MPLPPIVSFVAPSGTGKTTLIERLIPELRRRGLRVAAIKHDAHRIEVDREGKDTARMRRAGASPVVIASRTEFAAMGDLDGELPLLEVVARFASGADLVITEGYRRTDLPKIRVHRAARGVDPDWRPGEGVFACATDRPLGLGLPEVPLDDPAALADLLIARFGLGGERAPREMTPVILAGGASRRMGWDKAWLEVDGRPILPELARRGAEACGRRALVVAREGQALPEVDARVVRDLRPGQGPLGGLLTALAAMETPFALVIACDLPFVGEGLLRGLGLWGERGADAVVPLLSGRREPLVAVYAATCLPAVHRALLGGERRMDGFLGAVRVSEVPEEIWRAVDPEGLSFVNVNGPEDLEAVRARAGLRGLRGRG